jgi:septum formation protein
LLGQLGVEHKLLLPDQRENIERIEEPRSRELPLDYVLRVAKLKLDAARGRRYRRKLPEAPILAADTTVALGRKMFGKPAHPAEAREMLHALSGRTHRVLTAVAVSAGSQSLVALNVTRVEFCELAEIEINHYIASGEPRGKAGAYAIQGLAGRWVKHIEGSYSGVMGLPLHETAVLLRQAGMIIL